MIDQQALMAQFEKRFNEVLDTSPKAVEVRGALEKLKALIGGHYHPPMLVLDLENEYYFDAALQWTFGKRFVVLLDFMKDGGYEWFVKDEATGEYAGTETGTDPIAEFPAPKFREWLTRIVVECAVS